MTGVITYARCSTAEQADDGLSIEAQELKLKTYAGLYDLAVVANEVDAGVSAKTFGSLAETLVYRPGLARALAALDNGEAQALLVVKLDRLSRSVRDLDELVGSYFRSRFALISVSEQLDTRSAGGRLVLNILASVAQGERETIGERTAAALAYKRSRGEFLGGEPPYGWKVGADGVHLEAHRGEQHAIGQARMWRSLGLSLRRVGEALEGAGFYPRSGKHWHAETVKALLGADVAADLVQ